MYFNFSNGNYSNRSVSITSLIIISKKIKWNFFFRYIHYKTITEKIIFIFKDNVYIV